MADSRSFFLTGCASGIGKHLSGLLVEDGHRLFATDVNIDALTDHARKEGWPADRVVTATLDVRDPEEWESVFAKAVEQFGHIDVCMNIAGVLLANWVQDAPRNEVDAQIDINLKGVIYGTQVAARHMVERGEGHIVNIASLAGVAAPPGLSIYAASKHGVRGFSIAAALELRKSGVFVTAVCPDAIDTPMANISKENEAGAMFYSAPQLLTVEGIGRLLMKKVLAKKPMTFSTPKGRSILSHASNLFPSLGLRVVEGYLKKGRKSHQQHQDVSND